MKRDKSEQLLLTQLKLQLTLWTMTANETLQALLVAGKKIGRTRLYFYLDQLGIKPEGIRQRPQRYPSDTAQRILQHLGFTEPAGGVFTPVPRTVTRRPVKLVSLAQIRAARKTTNKKDENER